MRNAMDLIEVLLKESKNTGLHGASYPPDQQNTLLLLQDAGLVDVKGGQVMRVTDDGHAAAAVFQDKNHGESSKEKFARALDRGTTIRAALTDVGVVGL